MTTAHARQPQPAGDSMTLVKTTTKQQQQKEDLDPTAACTSPFNCT
jgi:hypothetical protein